VWLSESQRQIMRWPGAPASKSGAKWNSWIIRTYDKPASSWQRRTRLNIHPDSRAIIEAIVSSGEITSIHSGRCYMALQDRNGETVYTLSPAGFLEWRQYGGRCGVKVGKRLARKLFDSLRERGVQPYTPPAG